MIEGASTYRHMYLHFPKNKIYNTYYKESHHWGFYNTGMNKKYTKYYKFTNTKKNTITFESDRTRHNKYNILYNEERTSRYLGDLKETGSYRLFGEAFFRISKGLNSSFSLLTEDQKSKLLCS